MKTIYTIPAPDSMSATIEVYGDPDNAWYEGYPDYGVVNHITVYRTASASRLQNKQLADDLMVGVLHRHRLNAEAVTLCH